MPKRYQNLILWAWLKFTFTPQIGANSTMLTLTIYGNGNGIYIPHFLYVYIQMRFTPNL